MGKKAVFYQNGTWAYNDVKDLGDDNLGMLPIYIGVEGYRSNPHELGKYLALFFGVCVFILCGFEHCVANMYYFTMGGAWSGRAILYLLVMTLGNAVGGVIGPVTRKILTK